MSKRSLSSSEEKVLALGLNFALTPQSLPKEEIIQATEPTLHRLDKTTADEIRLDISQALRKHKNPKPNTTREDRSAIKSPRQNKYIHILLADKGNATAVMDWVEYDHKVMDILNSDSYRELWRDPMAAIERKLQQKLLSLHCSGNITEQLYRQLRPSKQSSSRPPLPQQTTAPRCGSGIWMTPSSSGSTGKTTFNSSWTTSTGFTAASISPWNKRGMAAFRFLMLRCPEGRMAVLP
jgi:hypothetical protein